MVDPVFHKVFCLWGAEMSRWRVTVVCLTVLSFSAYAASAQASPPGVAEQPAAISQAGSDGAVGIALVLEEDKEAAEAASRTYLSEGQARAFDNQAASMGLARDRVSDALAARRSAQAAYRKNSSITNFRLVTQTTVAHRQAVALAKAMEELAEQQFDIESNSVKRAAPMLVYAANSRVMLIAWDAPPVCADPYMEGVRKGVTTAVSAFGNLPVETREAFDAALADYEGDLERIYGEEVRDRNAYESARRAYAARPTPTNKSAMRAAKITMQGTIRVAAYDARDARTRFSQAENAVFDDGKARILEILEAEKTQGRVDGAALEECMLDFLG